MGGLKETKLYRYMIERKEDVMTVQPIEGKVVDAYSRVNNKWGESSIWTSMLEWLEKEATAEDLLFEFNSHELMELLLLWEE